MTAPEEFDLEHDNANAFLGVRNQRPRAPAPAARNTNVPRSVHANPTALAAARMRREQQTRRIMAQARQAAQAELLAAMGVGSDYLDGVSF